MCGSYHATKDWYPRCASSWDRIRGTEKVVVLDDGTLTDEDQGRIESHGYDVWSIEAVNERVEPALHSYPALRSLREESPLFRKIVDPNILFADEERVLFMDSDIHVRGAVDLPSDAPDLLYTVGDVSGYRGGVLLPLQHPVTAGLNAGFMYWNPSIVELGFLNELAERYLLQIDNMWWTLQSCWAAVAGRTDQKGAFDGRDVCNVSGLSKRTPAEVKDNVTKWIGKSAPVENPSVIEQMVEGASIVHFPGVGKKWIDDFAVPRDDPDTVHTLRWEPVENANLLERSLLALRMAWSNRQ
jgi:hypothetical protein